MKEVKIEQLSQKLYCNNNLRLLFFSGLGYIRIILCNYLKKNNESYFYRPSHIYLSISKRSLLLIINYINQLVQLEVVVVMVKILNFFHQITWLVTQKDKQITG